MLRFRSLSMLRYNGDTFKTEPSSTFTHYLLYALGSYRNSVFVTGSWFKREAGLIHEDGLKTEILDYGNGKWNQADDYPFLTGDRFISTLIFYHTSCEHLSYILVHLNLFYNSAYHITQQWQQKKAFL